MSMQIGWSGDGVVRRVRELKTKTGEIWRVVAEVMCLGNTVEIAINGLSDSQRAQFVDGAHLAVKGEFAANRSGGFDFMCTDARPAKGGAG